jgi:hypothetical protein
VTCEAVFIGPAADCGLAGEFVSSGTAGTEATARKRAMARLTQATELACEANAARTAGTMAAAIAEQERVLCPSVVAEQARISCFPSHELTMRQTCFADFPVEECPTPAVIILEGVGYKIMEKSRQQICRESDQMLKTSTLSDAEQLSCRSRCLTESRVRCR